MQAGDTVLIKTKNQEYKGRLMPSSEEGIIVVKLGSGYNVGIRKENITESKVLEEFSELEKQEVVIPERSDLPKISILHTGGTIASRVDYRTGGVVASFTPEDLLTMVPELAEIGNFSSHLVANMWSDDLRFENLVRLTKAIEGEIEKGARGVIVGMGTDNLAVASAAVSFMLQNSPVPVLFVGSQRSSDRGSSDAGMNLICASEFIAQTDWAGVGICMHHTSEDKQCAILPGNKTYKLHSSRRDAFKAVNVDPIATVDYEGRKVTFLSEDYSKRHDGKPEVKAKMEDRVGLLKAHVHMFPEELLAYKGFKGLVIEGTGLGQMPLHTPNEDSKPNEKVREALQAVLDSGTVVVMTTQTIFGRVNMNVYSKGRDLQDMGVIPGEDMLANTALVKLAWLLGNYSEDEAKKMIRENIAGEINDRVTYSEDFA